MSPSTGAFAYRARPEPRERSGRLGPSVKKGVVEGRRRVAPGLAGKVVTMAGWCTLGSRVSKR